MKLYFIKEVLGILFLVTAFHVSPTCQQKPDICRDASLDAITRTQDGSTYAFKGLWYWKINYNVTAAGYPRKIKQDWEGIEEKIDAALTLTNGYTYLFQGIYCFRFRNKGAIAGNPKYIWEEFPGIPTNFNAALSWSGNGKPYFFKGANYWRFDRPVSSTYPASISGWSGLPTGGVDAAFVWQNGVSYFFKDGQYYRWNDQSATASPPASTAQAWFSCPRFTRFTDELKKLF